MRSSTLRTKKYAAKLDGTIQQLQLERYGKVQKGLFRNTANKQVEIENQVKAYLANHGIGAIYTNYYILFAKNLAKKGPQESDIEFNKWAGRDLSWYHLRNIGRFHFLKRLNLWNVDKEPETVLYYPLSMGEGGTVFDKSGNGHDTAIQGATWITGVLGNGLRFDGDNDYLNPGNVGMTSHSLKSFCGWVKSTTSGGNQTICVFDNYSEFTILPARKLRLQLPGSVASMRYDTDATLNNDWNFVCYTQVELNGGGTRVAGDAILYINGVAQAVANTGIGASPGVKNDLIIGAYGSGSWGQDFLGDMDELRFFDRILTPTEILNIYNAEKPFHY